MVEVESRSFNSIKSIEVENIISRRGTEEKIRKCSQRGTEKR